MAKALENTLKEMKNNLGELKYCQEKLINELSKIEGIVINTDTNYSIPGIVNFSPIGYNPEVFIRALSLKGIYVSSRSACSVEQKDKVSSTLYAMKKDIDVCISSIRVSYIKPLSEEEIKYFIDNVKEVISVLRK